jgi:hypothetical protein
MQETKCLDRYVNRLNDVISLYTTVILWRHRNEFNRHRASLRTVKNRKHEFSRIQTKFIRIQTNSDEFSRIHTWLNSDEFERTHSSEFSPAEFGRKGVIHKTTYSKLSRWNASQNIYISVFCPGHSAPTTKHRHPTTKLLLRSFDTQTIRTGTEQARSLHRSNRTSRYGHIKMSIRLFEMTLHDAQRNTMHHGKLAGRKQSWCEPLRCFDATHYVLIRRCAALILEVAWLRALRWGRFATENRLVDAGNVLTAWLRRAVRTFTPCCATQLVADSHDALYNHLSYDLTLCELIVVIGQLIERCTCRWSMVAMVKSTSLRDVAK